MSEYLRYSPQRVSYVLEHGFLRLEEVATRYLKTRPDSEVGLLAINPWVLQTNSRAKILREQLYSGPMCIQLTQPTCTPLSIANAQRVIGLRPDEDILRIMLNNATDPNEDEYGLSFDKAGAIIKKFKNSGFYFEEAEQNLVPTFKLPSWRARAEERYNAALIRRLLRAGSIITGVEHAWYAKSSEHGSHAICISGYRTFRNGDMLVQILDSARCSLWVTISHLSASLDSDKTYLVSPRRAKIPALFT